MPANEIIYDTETTGPDTTFDQPLQVAAIVVDDDYVAVEELNERSRMLPYVVPTPGALKVTHLDPYEIPRAPHSPLEFACMFHNFISGYADKGDLDTGSWNGLNYDEEIMRRAYFMNLLRPYPNSGKGKRRIDYLLMTRALAARNPDCLVIPINEKTGNPNYKLENIATANGFTDHHAHDALGDVWATIHMARLIRDTDPDLFHHIKDMGAAASAVDFVESEQTFRIIGGRMVEPGILDACLIASDPRNPKAKTAWNLAVDPTPYLTMSPEEILEHMRQSGTPFRSVKCHKSPLVFPSGWGFLRHAAGTEAPTPDLIEQRSKLVRENMEFRQNVRQALALKADGYTDSVHLEEMIYDGFPSRDDENRMTSFHKTGSWSSRLDIARSFQSKTLQKIGMRLVWLYAPEILTAELRAGIDAHIAKERLSLDMGKPWTTVGSFMNELEDWEADHPGDAELANIRKWALETYPAAKEWQPGQGKIEITTAEAPAEVQTPNPAAAMPAPHFLDGIS